LKSRVYGIKQCLLAEGFVQKVHRAGTKGSRSRVVVCMGRDEDDRESPVGGSHLTLELESVHAGHADIQNQTRRIVQLIRVQERFSRRETLCPKSDGSD
jgi:hypothetical protein